MDRAFNILPKVLHKRGLAEHAQSALVTHRVQRWIDARFPALKGSVHVTSLKNGVLSLDCDHSIAASECRGAIGELEEILKDEGAFTEGCTIKIARN